jgi:hypothetical protein
MIASRKAAGIAFLGGAALALLSGCAEAPATATYYQPVPAGYVDPAAVTDRWRAYIQQQTARQAYIDQLNAWAAQQQQSYIDQLNAWREQQQSQARRFKVHRAPDDDGPVISDNPPASTPVPKAPADPDCVGWWRICHFL